MPRIFCHFIHICKELQRYRTVSSRKWQRWQQTGNHPCQPNLQVLPVSLKICINTLSEMWHWKIFPKVQLSCRKHPVFLHYLQTLKDVIREEQTKEWPFHSCFNLFTIIFSLPPNLPALGFTIQCSPIKILQFHMEELCSYKTVQLEFP